MRRTLVRAAAAVAGLALLAAVPLPATASERGSTTVDRSAGCGRASLQPPGTSQDHTIVGGDRQRTYRLHLPATYTPDRAWPLVLVFHGRGNSGATTEEFSGLSNLPAIVAYPDGEIGLGDGDRRAWQGAPYSPPGVDDVAFTGDLLDELENTLCVAPRHVYATGKSNGGAFTGILACQASDRIAAVAPVAGAFYPTGESCRPSRPVPVLEIHGTADVTIPYAGDPDRGLPAIQDWVAAWAERDGCTAGPVQRRIEPDISISTYLACTGGTEVEHVAVSGGGHTWPGADSYSGGGHTTQTIEAHEVVWRFFRQFSLPRH